MENEAPMCKANEDSPEQEGEESRVAEENDERWKNASVQKSQKIQS